MQFVENSAGDIYVCKREIWLAWKWWKSLWLHGKWHLNFFLFIYYLIYYLYTVHVASFQLQHGREQKDFSNIRASQTGVHQSSTDDDGTENCRNRNLFEWKCHDWEDGFGWDRHSTIQWKTHRNVTSNKWYLFVILGIFSVENNGGCISFSFFTPSLLDIHQVNLFSLFPVK